MFSTDDSIVALATPAGRGGIGVVRISGASSLAIAGALLDRCPPLEPRRATFARLRRDAGGNAALDEVIATYFPAPRSYTGEHTVEISAHGSPVVLESVVARAIAAGARLAEPGEFTLRSFLNGKRDLVQAEAVADLVEAATPLQARTAFDQLQGTLTERIAQIDAALFDVLARLEASLDFAEEGYHFIEPAEATGRIRDAVARVDALLDGARRGRLIREGALVAVVGRPNVGKSSLFNCLVGSDRAIVTDVPGTTRDLVSERIDLDGLAITLVDTAGARETFDVVEREGVARAARAAGAADLLLVVLDASEPLHEEDLRLLDATAARPRLLVRNKSDLAPDERSRTAAGEHAVPLSARTGAGITALRAAIVDALTGGEPLRDSTAISNVRHVALLEEVRGCLIAAADVASRGDTPEEIILSELQAARARLDEIVGRRTTEDVLEHIFARFCIGK